MANQRSTVNLPVVMGNKYITEDYSETSDVLALRARTNVLVYKEGEEVLLKPRPGFRYGPYAGDSTVSRVIIGGYYWRKTARFYYVAYNPGAGTYALYSRELGTNTLTITTITTVTVGGTSTRPGWAEWQYGGTFYLLLMTGSQGWYINTSDVATQIVDADFPTPHVPTPVVMDGYIFLPKINTSDIYSSDLGSVSSWSASAFISCEIEAGSIRALAKQKQHIVAFTDQNIEFFRNGGIPAPNSPLTRVESYNQKLACLNYTLLSQWEDDVYFVGTNKESLKTSVFLLSNFATKDIGDESMKVYLKNFGTSNTYAISGYVSAGYYSPDVTSTVLTSSVLSILNIKGQTLVVIIPLACDISTTSVASPVPAAVYSLSADAWMYWSQPDPTEDSTSDENLTNSLLSPGAVAYQGSAGTNNTAFIAKIIYNSSTIDPLMTPNYNIGLDVINNAYFPITSYVKLGPYDMGKDEFKAVHQLWLRWAIQPVDQTDNPGTLTVTTYSDNDVSETPVANTSVKLTKDVFLNQLGRYKNMYVVLKMQSNTAATTNSLLGELKGLGARLSLMTRL